jgi:hypothetical protein
MTENINLRNEEENLWYRKELLWVVFANSSLIWFSVSWWMSEFWHYFLLWNAIFDRIVFILVVIRDSDRILNESEFSNRIKTYFRFLVLIETINQRKILLIFLYFRLHLVESVFHQILCLLQSIKVLSHRFYWCHKTQFRFCFVRISFVIID